MRRLVSFGVLVAFVAFAALVVARAGAPAADRGRAAVAPIAALEVRSIYTSEFDLGRPTGIAYLPSERALVIAGVDGRQTELLRLSVFEDRLGVARVEGAANRASLAFDGASERLTLVDRHSIVSVDAMRLRTARPDTTSSDARSLQLQNPQGATFDAADGTWWVLDAGTRAIVGVRRGSAAPSTKISLRDVGGGRLQGLAVNPADGLLYVMSTQEDLLLGFDEGGAVQTTYSLAELSLEDPQAIVFAPSADPTDDPATQHLYVADAGGASTLGRVVEASLATAVAAAAVSDIGTQVQTIQTSQFTPPSPDPAGITYVSSIDRFIISDSEVDEMTIYQGANLYTATRTGSGVGTGTTLPSNREPSDVGYDATSGRLFAADDDGDKVSIFAPGADGRHGTADDTVTSFSTSAFGSLDAEGVEHDAATGHLFVSDGVGIEVYDIDPVDAVFGNGNDVVTHFDVAQFGSRDAEGIGVDPQTGHLLVIDPSTKSIYELTRTGGLVRIIDCRSVGAVGNRLFADVTVAPTSDPTDPPSRLNYWIVDRQVDNGADPNENDGLLYEVAAPSADSAPGVALTAPAAGATVSGTVTVTATASDDFGVTQVAFAVDGTTIGVDTNGTDGWSTAWNTATVADGGHTLSATATDTAGQTATASRSVTVDNVDTLPTVSLTQPAEGSIIRGTVGVQATAADEDGVDQVVFDVDGVVIGTDTNGGDGWSVSWDTTSHPNGPHTVRATATDTGGQTAVDSNGVTVDNAAPTVEVTDPAPGAVVANTVSIQAAASDNDAVASVQFIVDGSPVGTDTNGGDGWSVSWDSTTVSDGNHLVAARATDRAGNASTSAAVGVTVDNPDIAVLNLAVGVGVDDVEELPGGTMRRTGGDLELGTDKGTPTIVGIRFAGVTIPQGATITAAYIQFQSDERGRQDTSLVLRAQAADNAAGFTTALFNVSQRARTSASVSWNPPLWRTGGLVEADQRTPDLKNVLQEVVNRAGWSSGNALAMIVAGMGRRTAESFEGLAPPVLHVEYVRP